MRGVVSVVWWNVAIASSQVNYRVTLGVGWAVLSVLFTYPKIGT